MKFKIKPRTSQAAEGSERALTDTHVYSNSNRKLKMWLLDILFIEFEMTHSSEILHNKLLGVR